MNTKELSEADYAKLVQKCEHRLSTMKSKLLLHRVDEAGDISFFINFLISTDIHINTMFPTAATNGIDISVNPSFMDSLSEGELLFLIMHELHHIIFKHVYRGKGKNARIWNIATDSVINTKLVDDGFKLIEGVGAVLEVVPNQSNKDLTAEQIYNYLMENAQEMEQPEIFDLQPDKEDESEGTNSERPDKIAEQKLDEKILRTHIATEISNPDYNLEDGSPLERMLNNIRDPKVNWKDVLHKLVGNIVAGRDQYTWSRPNRRVLAATSIYMPSMYSETAKDLHIYLDVSGSLSDVQLSNCLAEIKGMMDMISPENAYVTPWHSVLLDRQRLDNVAELEISETGGTDIANVYRDIEKSKPEMAIVITDGEFDPYEKYKGSTSIVFAIYSNPTFKSDYGQVVHIDE